MGLQLIEGILLVFGNELWAIDGQLLVGIHGDHDIPNVGLEPKKKEKEMSGGKGQGAEGVGARKLSSHTPMVKGTNTHSHKSLCFHSAA